MVAIKRAIEPYEKKKVYERKQEHGNTALGSKKEENTMGKFDEVSKGRALDHIAGFVGVDRKTLKKAEDIVKAAEQCSRTRV